MQLGIVSTVLCPCVLIYFSASSPDNETMCSEVQVYTYNFKSLVHWRFTEMCPKLAKLLTAPWDFRQPKERWSSENSGITQLCRQECHRSFQIDKALKQFDCYCNHRINIKNVIFASREKILKRKREKFWNGGSTCYMFERQGDIIGLSIYQ